MQSPKSSRDGTIFDFRDRKVVRNGACPGWLVFSMQRMDYSCAVLGEVMFEVVGLEIAVGCDCIA